MTFTLRQALNAQDKLRTAANLPSEEFPVPALIGMLSDEIEALRGKGISDQQIAQMINDATGASLSPSTIAENYATPEERNRH
jgi:hypothetical protein